MEQIKQSEKNHNRRKNRFRKVSLSTGEEPFGVCYDNCVIDGLEKCPF